MNFFPFCLLQKVGIPAFVIDTIEVFALLAVLAALSADRRARGCFWSTLPEFAVEVLLLVIEACSFLLGNVPGSHFFLRFLPCIPYKRFQSFHHAFSSQPCKHQHFRGTVSTSQFSHTRRNFSHRSGSTKITIL